jgi:hypothetical protein
MMGKDLAVPGFVPKVVVQYLKLLSVPEIVVGVNEMITSLIRYSTVTDFARFLG